MHSRMLSQLLKVGGEFMCSLLTLISGVQCDLQAMGRYLQRLLNGMKLPLPAGATLCQCSSPLQLLQQRQIGGGTCYSVHTLGAQVIELEVGVCRYPVLYCRQPGLELLIGRGLQQVLLNKGAVPQHLVREVAS